MQAVTRELGNLKKDAMNLLKRLQLALSVKESQARIVSQIMQVGQAQSTPANYESFARKGYSANVAVYTAINKIAVAGGGVTWKLFNSRNNTKPTQILDNPLIKLMERPNPMQGTSAFIQSVLGYYLISGNSYIEKNKPFEKQPPTELWADRPDRMRIIPGKIGYPQSFEFTGAGNTKKLFPVDQVTLKSDMLHWKTFNPLNDWYGLSPLQAALLSLDINNAGKAWNLSMLRNSATPTGVLQMIKSEANPRGELTDTQYARIKASFKDSYQNAKNAGEPIILEGGLNWTQMSLSPKEMDWLKSGEVSAHDIFMVYGVPGEIVGLGTKTFNNYREAKLSFYEETVLPLLDSFRDDVLNKDIAPEFGENLWLDYDRDDIEALSLRREQKYTSLGSVNFLNQNEKREMVGKEPVEGWDVFVIGTQVGGEPEDFVSASPFGAPVDVGPKDETIDDPPKKPKKPKKPEPPEDDEDLEKEKGWKSINLVNQNEKEKAWKRQNRKRLQLEVGFKRDLKADFNELASVIAKASKLTDDPKLKEFAILNAIDQFIPNLERTISKNVRYTLEDFGQMILNEAKTIGLVTETKAKRDQQKYDAYVTQYVQTRTGNAITEIAGTTRKQVRRIVSEWVQEAITEGDSADTLAKYLQMEFEGLSEGRAKNIAVTEVGMASTNGALEAVKVLNVPNMQKEWVSADDGRVREDDAVANHAAMNGVSIALTEKFTVPPDADMDCPGDPSAGASQVCNCRCVLVYKTTGRAEV